MKRHPSSLPEDLEACVSSSGAKGMNLRAEVPTARPSSVGGLLSMLNLPGQVINLVGQILDYRLQMRQLELESERITAEAKLRHHQIDAAFKLEMRKLDARNQTLEAELKTVRMVLEQDHSMRMSLTQAAIGMMSQTCDPALNAEQRAEQRMAATLLLEEARRIGDQNHAKLREMAETTRQSLAQMPLERLGLD